MIGEAAGKGVSVRAGRDLSRELTLGILTLWAREGKWAEISVSGLSMSPLIPHGSRLTVRFGREGLSKGDVVLYTTPAHLVAHRVIGLGRRGRRWGWLKVKGDPLSWREAAWIPVEDVVGRVVAVHRPDGEVLLMNTLPGRVAGRLASCVSGPIAWTEGRLLSLGGWRGGPIASRLLLSLPALLYHKSRPDRARRAEGLPLRPEEKLLVMAARVRLLPAEREALRESLLQDVAWDRLVPTAAALGLVPLLHRTFAMDEFRDRVPPAVRAALARGAHSAACMMAIQMEGLDLAVAALRRAGIEPVLLKGAALALTLYEQPALRPMQDLDLLVRQEEVERAAGVLTELGLRAIRTSRGRDFYDAHHHAVPMIDSGGRLLVEIHRGIARPAAGLYVDPAPLIEWAAVVESNGRRYRVLSLEDQFLHAAIHLSHTDRFIGKLRDLLDIDALVDSAKDLDWGTILEAARSSTASRSLYTTLDLSRRLLGTPIPREVLSELSRSARWDPLAAGALRALGRRSLFTGPEPGRLLSDPVVRSLCDALIRGAGWRVRLREARALLGAPRTIAI